MKKGDLINIEYGTEGNICDVRIRSIEIKASDETTYLVGIMMSNGHTDKIQLDYAEIIKVAVENEVKGCMKMTESRTVGVFKKLREVQCKLIAPKNQYNAFGKYKYRSCEDILEGVKPLLAEIGAVVVIKDDIEQIGDRFYVKATAQFIDEETGEKVENTAYARESLDKKGMDSSQVTGATSSYARKYALNGLFCIDDVKDADTRDNNEANKGQSSRQNPPQQKPQGNEPEFSEEDRPATPQMLATIRKEMERTGVSEQQVLSFVKGKKMEAMTCKEFTVIMENFKIQPTKQQPQQSPIQTWIQNIHAEMTRTGVPESMLLQMIAGGKLEAMTEAEYQNIMNKFKATPNKTA